MKNFFEKNLDKLRKLLRGSDRLSFDDFMKISKLKYDDKNFRYYLDNPYDPKYDRIWEIEAPVVWKANERGDLLGLLREIIDHIEWEWPAVYNLGLHYDELLERKRQRH